MKVTQSLNKPINAAEMPPQNIARIPEPGTDLQVAEIVTGQAILGNNQWFKLTDGSLVWAGSTNYLGNYPWWLSDNNIPDFWPQTTGAGVKIALLDTGIQQNHPAFGSQVIKAAYTAKFPNIPDSDGSDIDGHGTECAGMIIAHDARQNQNCCGVAPESEIYSYCVYNAEAGDKPEFLVQGLQAAIADGVHIISISRNNLLSNAVQQEIANAIGQKIYVVISSGGFEDPNELLGATGIISVSALAADGTDVSPAGDPVNPNVPVTCYAPGITVRTTSRNGMYTPQPVNGSSFATPFIAGVLALKIQLHYKKNRSYYNSILADFNNALSTDPEFPVLNLKKFIV